MQWLLQAPIIQGILCSAVNVREEAGLRVMYRCYPHCWQKEHYCRNSFPGRNSETKSSTKERWSWFSLHLTVLSCVEMLTVQIKWVFFPGHETETKVLEAWTKLLHQRSFALKTKIWDFLPISMRIRVLINTHRNDWHIWLWGLAWFCMNGLYSAGTLHSGALKVLKIFFI